MPFENFSAQFYEANFANFQILFLASKILADFENGAIDFPREVSFLGGRFSGKADFSEARFSREANFSSAKFSE